MKQVTISNDFISLVVLDYGATIQKLLLKNYRGGYQNLVVGFNFPNDYLEDNKCMGACVGRYAGRISQGKFNLDRQDYHLYSEKGIHLHGGKNGFHTKYWTFEEVHYGDNPFVKLSYLSKHLEEGYPGNLKVTVTYQLVDSALRIVHEATTDRTTVVNLTNHSYFRFDDSDSVDDYRLQLNCSRYAEANENLLPTGKLIDVVQTDHDFLIEKPIGEVRLDSVMAIDPKSQVAAKLKSPNSKITMEVVTNQPALIVYMPPDFPAICIETQNFPDAPNQTHFPNSVLRPGEKYRNASEYRFIAPSIPQRYSLS